MLSCFRKTTSFAYSAYIHIKKTGIIIFPEKILKAVKA